MTEQTIQRPVILGTGQLGLTILDELDVRGTPVTLVNRSGQVSETLPERATLRTADLYDAANVRDVCAGADVVFLCAQPAYTAWPEKFPPLIDSVLAGLADVASSAPVTLVFGDNLYMYGPTGGAPISETLPYAATGHKGKTRVAMAEKLLAADTPGKLNVVIGRAIGFLWSTRHRLIGRRNALCGGSGGQDGQHVGRHRSAPHVYLHR